MGMKTVLLLLSAWLFCPNTRAQSTVDSSQLMKDVKMLSSDKMMGRKAGSRGSRKAQFYIKERFEAIGLKKLFNTYEQPFFFESEGEKIMGTNLIGYLKGTTDTWIVISAHYDHLGTGKPVNGDSIYNGADDNASGVAGLFALAQYFKEHPPRHNLLFVTFDAEEEGLQGARSFVSRSKEFLKNNKIKLNINMDMISHSQSNELYACGTHQYPQLKPYLQSAGEKSKIKLLFGHDGQKEGEASWVHQSDQFPFFAAGIPFIYFGVEDHPDYHKVSDSFETITPSFFYHAVQTILMATENIDQHLGLQIKIPPRSRWIMEDGIVHGIPVKIADTFSFTEGPAVDAAGNVYFTDQPNNRILKYDLSGEITVFLQPAGRSNGMYFDRKGNLITCADEKSQLWSISPEKKISVLVNDFHQARLNGPNDLWIAPDGGIYITDPYYQRKYWTRTAPDPAIKGQYVYYLPKGDSLLQIVDSTLVQPNGIIGTPDGKHLYVADIKAEKTYRYDIAADGSLTHKTLFVARGSDGMTIDRQGNIYLTGKGVTIYNAQGKKKGHIAIPEPWAANVCFYGEKRNYLFITASKAVYLVKMSVAGIQ